MHTIGTEKMYSMAAIDTPGVFEGQHAEACDYPNKSLGKFSSAITIAVVGAGFSGLLTARSLAMCGAKVELYEAQSRPAGRAQSEKLATNISSNLGPMRHGDGFGALKRTIEHFGFTFDKRFENPDTVPTAAKYNGKAYDPNDEDNLPWQIKVSLTGWRVLERQGFEVNGKIYAPINQMREWLKIPDNAKRLEKKEEFERFIVDFGSLSLYQFFEMIFITNSTPPGGNKWKHENIMAIAAYPFTTGNIFPFLHLGCLWFLKIGINGCETNQLHFCEINVNGSRSIGDYQKLSDTLLEDSLSKGVSVFMNTEITEVERQILENEKVNYLLSGENQSGPIVKKSYDEIVFAVPPAALAKIIDKREELSGQLYPVYICDTVRNIHMIKAAKIEWLVSKQPFIDDPTLIRCLQIPSTLGQVYTLECNSPHFLKAQVYAWGDIADEIAAQGPADQQYEYAMECIEKEFRGSHIESVIPYYKKVEEIGQVVTVNWNDNPWSQGAFSYPLPHQHGYSQRFLNLFLQRKFPLIAATGYYDDDWWKYCDRNSQLTTVSLIERHKGTVYNSTLSPMTGLEKSLYQCQGDESVHHT